MRATTLKAKMKARLAGTTYPNKSPRKMTRKLENMIKMKSVRSEWACQMRGMSKLEERHWRKERLQDQSRTRTWSVDITHGMGPVQGKTNVIALTGDMERCR